MAPTGTHTWGGSFSSPFGSSGTIRIMGDLIIPNGSIIQMRNLNFEFGPNGRIMVEPGGLLSINGCELTGDPVCQTMWQGIRVYRGGNGNGILYSDSYLDKTTIISQALIGVLTTNIPVRKLSTVSTQLTSLPIGSDFSNSSVFGIDNLSSTLFSDIWTHPAMLAGGGKISINSTSFVNCYIGLSLVWNVVLGQILPDAMTDDIDHTEFVKEGTFYYPFNNLPKPEAGIQILNRKQVEVENSTFQDLRYGIRKNSSSSLFVKGNSFGNCSRGLSMRNIHGGVNYVLENNFNDCKVAVQIQDEAIIAARNDINWGNNASYGIQPDGTFVQSIGFLLFGSAGTINRNKISNVARGVVLADMVNEPQSPLSVTNNVINNTDIACALALVIAPLLKYYAMTSLTMQDQQYLCDHFNIRGICLHKETAKLNNLLPTYSYLHKQVAYFPTCIACNKAISLHHFCIQNTIMW